MYMKKNLILPLNETQVHSVFAEANNKQYVCVLYQMPTLIFIVQTQTLKSGPILHRSMVMIFIPSRLESVCSESCYNCDAYVLAAVSFYDTSHYVNEL